MEQSAGGTPLALQDDFDFVFFLGGLPFRVCFLKGWVLLLSLLAPNPEGTNTALAQYWIE